MRGHGDSERPENAYRVADFAKDVVAFMDAKGLAEATPVGHSLGSFVAQWVALEHSGRVRQLVLIGSAGAVLNEGTAVLAGVFGTLTDPVPPEFVREFQESTIYHPVPEVFLEAVIAARAIIHLAH